MLTYRVAVFEKARRALVPHPNVAKYMRTLKLDKGYRAEILEADVYRLSNTAIRTAIRDGLLAEADTLLAEFELAAAAPAPKARPAARKPRLTKAEKTVIFAEYLRQDALRKRAYRIAKAKGTLESDGYVNECDKLDVLRVQDGGQGLPVWS